MPRSSQSSRELLGGFGPSVPPRPSFPEAPIDTKSGHVRYFATKVRYYHSYAVTFGKVVL